MSPNKIRILLSKEWLFFNFKGGHSTILLYSDGTDQEQILPTWCPRCRKFPVTSFSFPVCSAYCGAISEFPPMKKTIFLSSRKICLFLDIFSFQTKMNLIFVESKVCEQPTQFRGDIRFTTLFFNTTTGRSKARNTKNLRKCYQKCVFKIDNQKWNKFTS